MQARAWLCSIVILLSVMGLEHAVVTTFQYDTISEQQSAGRQPPGEGHKLLVERRFFVLLDCEALALLLAWVGRSYMQKKRLLLGSSIILGAWLAMVGGGYLIWLTYFPGTSGR